MLVIANLTTFRYTTLMPSPTLQRLATATIVALMLIPASAAAYMTAEDVLLNDEFFLPPTARATQDRVARQAETSAERRKKVQGESFETQHASAPEEVPEDALIYEEEEEESAEATENLDLSATDLELLRTLRLLDRISTRQQVLQYGPVGQQVGMTHTGAPLAPTGAGAWIAATTMIGAVGWTLRRAKRNKAWSL